MGWAVNATFRALYSLERPSTHYVGGWVGPRRKISPPPRFGPRTVRPLAGRYNDCAKPAHSVGN